MRSRVMFWLDVAYCGTQQDGSHMIEFGDRRPNHSQGMSHDRSRSFAILEPRLRDMGDHLLTTPHA